MFNINSIGNETLKKSVKTSWIIIKLLIPFSIASDILQYYGLISYISFMFEPITNSLNLSSEVALSFASAIFFNIYAGIAVASTLNLSAYEWTIVGTFIAICHSLPLESAILKKVGIGHFVHWVSRISLGYLGAWIAMNTTANDLITVKESINMIDEKNIFFMDMLISSIYDSFTLAFKVIVLVVSLVFLFEFIKKMSFFEKLLNKYTYLSSLCIGGLLGITYGAGMLLQEVENVSAKSKILLLVFLMLAHALIEETILFAFFGADVWNILFIRVGIALVAVLLVSLYLYKKSSRDDVVNIKGSK